MRKLTCLALVLMLTLSLAACGNESNNTETNPQSSAVSTTTPKETQTTAMPQGTEGKSEQLIKVPGKQIYFSTDVDWKVDNDDLAIMLYENRDCMVGICYNWISEFDGNYEGLIESLSANFVSEASSKCHGYLRTSQVVVLTNEMCNIAGYDCMKFTGKIDNDGNWDCHVYGYAYVVNDVQLMVIGIVSTEDQDAAMIADINALTDQIAASVRTEQ